MKKASLILFITIFFGLGIQEADAELKGNYQFQGDLSSSVAGAPDLVDLGTGSFAVDTVNGISRQVFVFNEGEGLRLDINGLIPNDVYTIVVHFMFDTRDNAFQKVIDFENFGSDMGLYVTESHLRFYNEAISSDLFPPVGTYAQVILTRDSSDNVIAYVDAVDGMEEFSFPDGSSAAVISNDNFLHFFRDDGTPNNENAAGAVACIQVYDEALSKEEIEQLDCLEIDEDGDGVLDAEDACLSTPIGEAVDEEGCAISQLCPCDNDWKNHGKYVSCVAKTSKSFVRLGLISKAERREIVSDAARSFCGHKEWILKLIWHWYNQSPS